MESVAIEGQSFDATENVTESQDFKEFESAENFQKFIYELFEKNGILNDLRAYLRGHIVNVLKSAQTGDPPRCQKHFTQRLELTFQALNMLIAEYLLRLEFSYTISVFVSEIPLANMVFDFAKTLLNTGDEKGLKFKESDVWSVLNYLGIKCDSEHALNIVQMYKCEDHPLLLCILRCIPMYQRECTCPEQMISSNDSLMSSVKSSDSMDNKDPRGCRRNASTHERCKHYVFCKACQSRFVRLREKYKKKKKSYAKNLKQTSLNPMSMESLMKNISVMERSLINEMFQQLKTVYEAEVDMMKEEEEKKVKRSLAVHALQLQRRRDEMEEAFKAREAELERNVQQKKKFLWGLARALRDQHGQMARAMLAVRYESERLTAKEDGFKKQLLEAEQILRKRGEDMRKQISNELAILEEHLESMKSERDHLQKERSELEDMRSLCERDSNIIKPNNLEPKEDIRSHYDLLRNEMSILRKYLETTKLEAKCVIDRSTVTEFNGVASKLSISLNNEQDVDRNYMREKERGSRTPNQVVNDFKKAKNVNFSQANLDEVYRERSRERSRSSMSSVGGSPGGGAGAGAGGSAEPEYRCERDAAAVLRDENDRLKSFARQQRDHIDELSSQQTRLQAQLAAAQFRCNSGPGPLAARPATWRPCTAPARMPTTELYNGRSVNASASANNFGWRKGAGEELSLFSEAQPRIVVPGDTVPFIGVLRERRSDSRRHLINQWRALRRRYSPLGAVAKLRGLSPSREMLQRERPSPEASGSKTQAAREEQQQLQPRVSYPTRENVTQRSKTTGYVDKNRREKSPKSLLREAKENLRNKNTTHKNVRDSPPATERDKSPNSVLREAKLRLRKLEIEAEAVEKSYLDFRKRQTELKEEWTERTNYSAAAAKEEEVVTKDVEVSESRRSRSLQKLSETHKLDREQSYHRNKQAIKRDFDKYLLEYEMALNVGSHFTNRNTVSARIQPIPQTFSSIDKNIDLPHGIANDDYLEKSLTEFRKLYHSPKGASPFRVSDIDMNKIPSKNVKTKNLRNNVPTKNSSTKNVPNITAVPIEEQKDEQNTEVSRSCSSFMAIKDALIKEKNSKKAELEILKRNITKMYNLREPPTSDSPEIQSLGEPVPKQTIKSDVNVIEISEAAENMFRIEVETVSESEQQDVLLVVQSSVETSEVVHSDSEVDSQRISTNMTILISPKRSSPSGGDGLPFDRVKSDRLKSPEKSRRSISPEQAARLTRNDVLDAIFHTDMKEASSLTMQPEPASKEVIEDSISEVEKDIPEDYPDDFSADVDNYNSRSEYDRSPISLPKTSEDENFWDS